MEKKDIALIVGLHVSQYILSMYHAAAGQEQWDKGIILCAQWKLLSFGLSNQLDNALSCSRWLLHPSQDSTHSCVQYRISNPFYAEQWQNTGSISTSEPFHAIEACMEVEWYVQVAHRSGGPGKWQGCILSPAKDIPLLRVPHSPAWYKSKARWSHTSGLSEMGL